MNLLFAASEIAPFFRTGGLAEVAGSLPAALAGLGVDVRAVMPLYQGIGEEYRDRMRLVTSFQVQLSWRSQYCGVYELAHNGVIHYFLDNEYYFKRPMAYGEFDDGERFAFFSRAILELPGHVGFTPDVIHCNDWQTGLVPVYLDIAKRHDPKLSAIKTVYTIHNIEYQGKYDGMMLGDVFGIPSEYEHLLQYDGALNLMKGAIVTADRVTTVSPTYSREIMSPEFAQGLHGILNAYSGKLSGILNGIDVTAYNPETDRSLFANYTKDQPEGKVRNKVQLQKMLGLTNDPDVPMIGIISRLTGHKGIDLIAGAMEGILNENIQLVVLGTGDWRYEQMFTDLACKHPGKVSASIVFSNDLSRKIYAASDLFLMPSRSEPCGLAQMIALRYGALPIVRETGGLADSIKSVSDDGAAGNGFTFAPYSSTDMLYTIRRALSFYSNRPLWHTLFERAMESDFSWASSAGQYLRVYEDAMGATPNDQTKQVSG